MTQHKGASESEPFADLRIRAEDWLGVRRDKATSGDGNSESDAHRLIHELHVHQIELEMQNEELQQAQRELEEGLTRYTDLYEFAPVGYLMLNRNGVLGKVNLTGARLLGLERTHWVGRRLALLFPVEIRSAFDAFLAKAFESQSRTTHEMTLHPEGADPTTIEFTATNTEEGQDCFVVVADNTRCKRAEQVNKDLRLQLEQSRQQAKPGAFPSGAVHALNDILGEVLGGLSMLELQLDQAGHPRQGVEHVRALAERGADLTKQLQEFAKGEPSAED